jgi:nucleoprotein TPR
MMDLSPTVAMASWAQRSGKAFTVVHTDHARLQDEYAKRSAEYDGLAGTLAQILARIEGRGMSLF